MTKTYDIPDPRNLHPDFVMWEMLWDEIKRLTLELARYDEVDRQKTREINLLTPENKRLRAAISQFLEDFRAGTHDEWQASLEKLREALRPAEEPK